VALASRTIVRTARAAVNTRAFEHLVTAALNRNSGLHKQQQKVKLFI
jgi:hypothetical protein